MIRELEQAEQMSAGNSVLTLQFCVNYGGQAEIADAAAAEREHAAVALATGREHGVPEPLRGRHARHHLAIAERDRRDAAQLAPAPDAHTLDTTGLADGARPLRPPPS